MRPALPMTLFALASLAPLALFATGLVLGGVWVLLVLVYMTAFVLLLDQVIPYVAGDAPEGAEFPGSDALLVAIGIGHLVAFPLVVWAVAGPSGLDTGARVALFVGAGLWFGQVTNPAAHELIHRGNVWLFRLGAALYVTLLFGHHASAHRLVHHVRAASREDPNTARAGESYYRFFLRAWGGSFREGWRVEAARARGLHPYAWYLGGSVLCLALGFVVAGWLGVAVWAGLALHATSQLMLSDYVQHYGLSRARRADGRLEPVGPRHSWNAPHWFSSAMMLNAPRHSDHHAHPARPYPALRLAGDAPMLPWPLPLACTIALVPPLWRRLIGPHLAPWRARAVTEG
jgi:alkane 1-monooxygenase